MGPGVGGERALLTSNINGLAGSVMADCTRAHIGLRRLPVGMLRRWLARAPRGPWDSLTAATASP